MVKRCQNIFIGLTKTCLGILDRGERDKNNETGLKEGGGIEMSTTVLCIYAMHALSSLFVFTYLPCHAQYSYNYEFVPDVAVS